MKYFGGFLGPRRELSCQPRFWGPEDMTRPPQTLEAWWLAPNHWRPDDPESGRPRISYRMIRDRWAWWQDDTVQTTGTIGRAREQHLTETEAVTYGRPYLTPAENAHLWLWLNPGIWAASLWVDRG